MNQVEYRGYTIHLLPSSDNKGIYSSVFEGEQHTNACRLKSFYVGPSARGTNPPGMKRTAAEMAALALARCKEWINEKHSLQEGIDKALERSTK